MSKQFEFFEKYCRLEERLDEFKIGLLGIRSYVQNDFERMIESDYASKEQIRDSAMDFAQTVTRSDIALEKFAKEYKELNREVFEFLKDYL